MILRRMMPMVAALALVLSGCVMIDSDDGDGIDDEQQRLAPGYTPCGDAPDDTNTVICHPNQYCASQTFARCEEGCLSNDNCTDDQHCFKEYGEDIGTCVDAIADDGGESEYGSSEESFSEDDSDNNNGSERGYTSCGTGLDESTCHPNQYCADDYWGDCELGCLSNDNCAEDQECVKDADEDVGSCQQT